MATIDVHAHILPRSAVRAHATGKEWFGSRIERTAEGRTDIITGSQRMTLSTPEYWFDYPERVPLMDAARVDVQVLSLNPQLFRDHQPLDIAKDAARAVNEEIAGAVASCDSRFMGLAALPMQDSAAAIAELEYATKTLGLKGMIVGTHVSGHNWDDPDLFDILAAAERLGSFVLLHPFSTRVGGIMPGFHMRNLIGNPMETTVAAGCLIFAGVMERLPRLKICLSHAGGYLPFAIGRFDHGHGQRADISKACPRKPSEYLRSFYYDIISHSDAGLEQVISIVGADRLLLGTDFPADMSVSDPVDFLEAQAYLSDADRAAITGGTAARLLA